jgi:large subunit ribosomal protein L11
MAKKEVKATIRLQIPGGAATPAPPVGAQLGQQGVNIMEFVKQFNAKTADKKGQTIPVVVTVYKDKKFDFVIKTPPTSELIKKKINLAKGSSKPGVDSAGSISSRDIEDIAKVKMADLNALTLDKAKKIIEGCARSMGIKVVD